MIRDSKTIPKRFDGILEVLFYPTFVKSGRQIYTEVPKGISFNLRGGTANAKNFSVRMNELVKQPAVRFSGNFFHVYECDNQSEEKRDTDWAVDRKEVIAWIERCT